MGETYQGPFIVNRPNVALSYYNDKTSSLNRPRLTNGIKITVEPQEGFKNDIRYLIYNLAEQNYTDDGIGGVWVQGRRYIRARYPNAYEDDETFWGWQRRERDDFLYMLSKNETASPPYFTPPQDLKELNTKYWVGARIRHNIDGNAFGWATITDVVNNKFLVQEPVADENSQPSFCMEHGFEELDAPGEYYFDSLTNMLFVVPFKDHICWMNCLSFLNN